LARLNTRWAELPTGEDPQIRVQKAADYYQAAMSLSPQNAVIINEYARLAFSLQEDCDAALALFEHSAETDPFYTVTYFAQAEMYRLCAARDPEGDSTAYYAKAVESLQTGLGRDSKDIDNWLMLADLSIQIGDIDRATLAYEEAGKRTNVNTPQIEIDLFMSSWFLNAGDLERTEEYGRKAVDLAPESLVVAESFWLQLARLYINVGLDNQALRVYEVASQLVDVNLPQWQIDLTMGEIFFENGDLGTASSFGQRASGSVPAENAAQVQQFLQRIVDSQGPTGE
jgi:tetratricopeptide (TPR) repeat protein